MSWWGKLVGGTFGFMLGGPLGAVLGAALGHNFDRGFDSLQGQAAAGFDVGDRERVQTAFFSATFAVMGHLAKADGRVSEPEIGLARQVMAQMGLTGQLRDLAMRLFYQGKQPDFALDPVLDQLRQECHGRRNLVRMFLEIQLHAAFADGVIHGAERRILEHCCHVLRFPVPEFRHLENIVRAAREFAPGGEPDVPAAQKLEDAYKVLGVAPQTSDAEVKKAYRRMMNQHHPDKLVSRGLPEEMINLATEKTQEIKAAYDTIKQARA